MYIQFWLQIRMWPNRYTFIVILLVNDILANLLTHLKIERTKVRLQGGKSFIYLLFIISVFKDGRGYDIYWWAGETRTSALVFTDKSLLNFSSPVSWPAIILLIEFSHLYNRNKAIEYGQEMPGSQTNGTPEEDTQNPYSHTARGLQK